MGILSPLIKKLINPLELARILKMQRNRKKVERVYDDAQLKLYGQILKGDFLHYGYFDDPNIKAEDISLNMIYHAQWRYADLLASKIENTQGEILDIGCGMGGLIKILLERGMKPVALTPDKTQIHHITEKYPQVQRYHCRFEDIPLEENRNRFTTLITSESLQYLKLDEALPLLYNISTPDAQWVACDYFRTGDKAEKSGHQWNVFLEKLHASGWEIVYEQDVTPNILPTIAYVYHWGNNILKPLVDFGIGKMEVKAPGWHYAAAETIEKLKEKLEKNLRTVDPELFGANKRYKLLVFKKKSK